MSSCICFPTLAAAHSSSPTIPAGTPAVVVEQFDSNSAVSHALYLPTILGTAPSHSLYFQNGTTYWVIHPDYISLEAAGAPPSGPPPGGDCAPAMQNLLRYWVAVGRMKLNLWERDYVLNSVSSTILLGLTVPSNSGLAILGKGQSVSRLVVPYPANTSGALAVVLPDTTCQYLFRDFSVISTGATSQAVSCGTAIAMTVNIQGANLPQEQYGGIVDRVNFGPTLDSNGNGLAYFSTALNLTGTARPLVSNTTICGCAGPLAEGNYADSSPRYAMQTGIVLDECYSPHVTSMRLWHAATAVSYNCQTTNAQGYVLEGCNFEGVRTGIYVRHAGQSCPNGRISSSIVQFRDFGFDLGNILVWNVSTNQFRNEWDGQTRNAYDIRFIAATLVMLTGNAFSIPVNPSRVNILVDAASSSYGDSHGIDFLIDTQQFGQISPPSSPANFAISAIKIIGPATNIQVGATNQFIGPFTGPIVDDAAGIAVTLVGIPNNSSTNPPAVVPQGSPNNILNQQPTLGTAAAAWPETFNVLHFLLATNAPTAIPINGWGLFSDNAGNLIAYNGSKYVTLASR